MNRPQPTPRLFKPFSDVVCGDNDIAIKNCRKLISFLQSYTILHDCVAINFLCSLRKQNLIGIQNYKVIIAHYSILLCKTERD